MDWGQGGMGLMWAEVGGVESGWNGREFLPILSFRNQVERF